MNQQSDQPATPPSRKYRTAESRWAGVGPYYAMFPTAFADAVIEEYTQPGEAVLDPFAGRGTAIFSAMTQHRPATGIEIHPLGFVYANAKLKTGERNAVVRRLEDIAEDASRYREAANALPTFFHCCYSGRVREFLLATRDNLDWRRKRTDRTLMALVLISLHGKIGRSLSNQMRQSTAMSPDYCVRWWREKQMSPPDVDPVAFMSKRIAWRYAHGRPQTGQATVLLGDSTQKLLGLAREVREGKRAQAKLLLTSPPYHNVTNYYYDQWLRLWLLGGPERPGSRTSNRYGGKFSNRHQHRQLVDRVFAKLKPLLAADAVVYIRTDRRESTYQNTLDALTRHFPGKSITEILHPLNPDRQPKPYSRGGAPRQANCEVDLILKPR